MPIHAARAALLAENLDQIIDSADHEELLALVVVLDGRRALVWELLRERRKHPRPKRHDPEIAVTTKVAAQRLSVHEDTVRAMCRDGKLRSIKIGEGEQYRIPESALEELMAGRRGKDS